MPKQRVSDLPQAMKPASVKGPYSMRMSPYDIIAQSPYDIPLILQK